MADLVDWLLEQQQQPLLPPSKPIIPFVSTKDAREWLRQTEGILGRPYTGPLTLEQQRFIVSDLYETDREIIHYHVNPLYGRNTRWSDQGVVCRPVAKTMVA
jgi:hypothetical protein